MLEHDETICEKFIWVAFVRLVAVNMQIYTTFPVFIDFLVHIPITCCLFIFYYYKMRRN